MFLNYECQGNRKKESMRHSVVDLLKDKFEVWPILVTNEVAKGKFGILLVVKRGNDRNF